MNKEINFGIPFLSNKRPLVIAHRGSSGKFPENSLAALSSAVEKGVDALEMDAYLTQDGDLVVHHDETVDRTTDSHGKISSFNLEDLKKLDAGYSFTPDSNSFPFRGKGLQILTLKEVFENFSDMRINLDIKDTAIRAPEAMAELIREFNRELRTMVGSFHAPQLFRFRRLAPKVPTIATAPDVKRFLVKTFFHITRIGRYPFTCFQVPVKIGNKTIVSPKFIKAAHARNLAVLVWTINEKEEMQKLLDVGVDGIFTDFPNRLLEVLEERQ